MRYFTNGPAAPQSRSNAVRLTHGSRLRSRMTATLLAVAVCFLSGSAALNVAKAADSQPKPDVTKAPVQVTVDPNLIKIHTKKAIQHVPFKITDPKTGKEVSPSAMITLPDGTQKKAGDYYAELNKFEKKFNEMGYTLRTKGGQKVLLQEHLVEDDKLNAQAKTISDTHKPFDAAAMKPIPKPAELATNHAQIKAQTSARVQGIQQALTGSAPANGAAAGTQNVKTWDYTVGNKAIMAAFVQGNIQTKGATDAVTIQAEANAGGYLINHRMDLLQAKGSVTAPLQGAIQAKLNVYVMGQSIYNLDKSEQVDWQVNKVLSKTYDYSTTLRHSIGPISINVRLGARGNAGINVVVGVHSAHATLQVTPQLKVQVYAQASVDAIVAKGGVGGEVTLLNGQMQIGADLGLSNDPAKGLTVTEHFYVQDNVEALAGKLYVFAKVSALFFSHEWHWNLWNWKGFKSNGYLVNISKTTTLAAAAAPAATTPSATSATSAPTSAPMKTTAN
jgi:hypothetical protein